MIKKLFDTLMVPTCQPKDSNIPMGHSFEKDGKLYYVDGKNRVCLGEHFAKTDKSVVDLVENTIRYEAKNVG